MSTKNILIKYTRDKSVIVQLLHSAVFIVHTLHKTTKKHVVGIMLQSFVIMLYFTIPYHTIYLAQSIMLDVYYAKIPISVLS